MAPSPPPTVPPTPSPAPVSAGSTSTAPQNQTQKITIGVLALQGAFIEHIHYLHKLRINGCEITAIAVRSASDLSQCSALIIPGGESTVMTRVASSTPGLLPLLLSFVRDPLRPVWGTCAGMILMSGSRGIGGGKVRAGATDGGVVDGWGGMPGLRVWRNLYGVHSILPLHLHEAAQPVAPPSVSLATTLPTPPLTPSPSMYPSSAVAPLTPIVPLATLPAGCTPAPPPADSPLGPADPAVTPHVMLRQGRKMVTSFHPELSGDTRVHRYWVERCVLGRE